MNVAWVALRGLVYYYRVHLAVAAAVAVATAVLTGALLVGDSMRGSLRQLTLDRLGQIDFVLLSDHFFRSQLAGEIAGTEPFTARFDAAVPATLMPRVTVEAVDRSAPARASGVMLIGCDDRFWQLDTPSAAPSEGPGPEEIWLNRALADQLRVAVGDRLVVRLPQHQGVPADSPLGRKDSAVRNVANLRVAVILPDEGLARFQLHATQARSLNAFIHLETLQQALNLSDRVNAILFAASSPQVAADPESTIDLNAWLAPTLDDFQIRIERVRQTYVDDAADRGSGDETSPPPRQESVAYEYLHVVSDRLIWSDAARQAALKAFERLGAQEVFTYLATRIGTRQVGDDEAATGIPYSTITAVDSTQRLGPLLTSDGAPIVLTDDQIVVNDWAATDLGVEVGDAIWVSYFAPETVHGVAEQRSERFTLAAITPLTRPAEPFQRGRPARYDQPPTRATDPHLTPEVPGVTDQQTIADWDPPFPFDQRRVRPRDDEYWDEHRTTPKAFISLEAGKRLWGSRFGATTSFRLPAEGLVEAELAERLQVELRAVQDQLGFTIIPIKQNALRASEGTTSFSGLFLGFSLFLIIAALALLGILFRLNVDLRLPDLGLLSALGWTSSRTRQLMLIEGGLISMLGAVAGVALGAGYAALMLTGLRSWWVDAIVTPFVTFHATPASLIGGGVASVLTCLLVMGWSLRAYRSVAPRAMLAGVSDSSHSRLRGRGWGIGILLVVFALALGAWATRLSAEAQAGAFFGSGVCVLAAGWFWLRGQLAARAGQTGHRSMTLPRLAWMGLVRNPGRTMMTVGLIASACFLLIAISAFRLQPSERGTGGFELIAETDVPVFVDFADPTAIRRELGEQADKLAATEIIGLRAEAGSDASCRNLYQGTRPRMLGISRRAADGGLAGAPLAWAGTLSGEANPWLALFAPTELTPDGEEVIPVILDKNTALYSLHAGGTIGSEFRVTEPDGRTFLCRTVGLLSNSIFQGKLLVAEEQLIRLFPANSGQRFFLINHDGDDLAQVDQALTYRFGDQGWASRSADEVLAELLAIQNTYLSTFQSLGALGLLLGTVGLACVQVRNVMERRRELGLLQALGFGRQRVARLIFLESALILILGLVLGTLAALVTTLPHMAFGAASVPWQAVTLTLAVVLACGLATAAIAVRVGLATPVRAALRGE